MSRDYNVVYESSFKKKCSKDINNTKQSPELISRAHTMINVAMLPPMAASVVSTGASALSGRSCEMAKVQIYCRYPQFSNRPCLSCHEGTQRHEEVPWHPLLPLHGEPCVGLSCCRNPCLLGTTEAAKQRPGVSGSMGRASNQHIWQSKQCRYTQEWERPSCCQRCSLA